MSNQADMSLSVIITPLGIAVARIIEAVEDLPVADQQKALGTAAELLGLREEKR